MAKNQKSARPNARLPRGLIDRAGGEIAAERDMLARITGVYESYGFDPLETPALEFTDALGKFLPDVERPNEGVFSLRDDDEQWMSLRYDLTAPLARYVAQNYDAIAKPFRRFAVGSVWRNEKPGPGRYRQFTQCDADTVGAPAPHADAEMAMLFADAVEAAGIARGDYVVAINDRRLMDGVLEMIGVDARDDATRGRVLRALDKYDRLGAEGVEALLGAGREDESGDFTAGAGLAPDQIRRVFDLFRAKEDEGLADPLAAAANLFRDNATGMAGVETLSEIMGQARALGFGEDRLRVDFSVIRGLDYYTGPVFEAELLGRITDDKGRPVRIGSVGGGGRYDGLVKRFRGQDTPAVGVSVGVSRLLAALALRDQAAERRDGPIVVLALEKDRMADYQAMAGELRRAGLRAETFVGSGNFAKQLKYADRRGAPVAVIAGADEFAKGEVTIKDLALGARLAAEIEDNRAWREEQPAQFSSPRADLVEAVRARLSSGS